MHVRRRGVVDASREGEVVHCGDRAALHVGVEAAAAKWVVAAAGDDARAFAASARE